MTPRILALATGVLLAGLGSLSAQKTSLNMPASPGPTPSISRATTPAMPNSWEEGNAQAAADSKARADQIKIIFLGDSITARWTTGAGRDIWKERYEPVGATNLGVSADGVRQVLWRLQHGTLEPLNPKVVCLMIGTNNLGSTPEEVANGVWAIVNYIRTQKPGTRILVAGIFPKSSKWTNTEKIAQINALLTKLDDGKAVKYIYFGDKFLTPEGKLNLDWFPDGVHPEKPEAFQIWADALQPTIDEWLNAPPVGADVPPPSVLVDDPKALALTEPLTRNDWDSAFKKQLMEAAKGKCDLLFMGDNLMGTWGRAQDVFLGEYKAYNPLNFAIWGNETQNMLYQLQNGALDKISPRVVVIQMQTWYENNIPADVVEAGLQEVVKTLHAKLPEAKIVLESTLPPPDTNDSRRAEIKTFNDALAGLANGKDVFYLDLGKAFVNEDGTLKPTTPNYRQSPPEAYKAWADAQRDLLVQLLGAPQS